MLAKLSPESIPYKPTLMLCICLEIRGVLQAVKNWRHGTTSQKDEEVSHGLQPQEGREGGRGEEEGETQGHSLSCAQPEG